jgi:4a-hydroxytetrahydrobiopterin dehydratase
MKKKKIKEKIPEKEKPKETQVLSEERIKENLKKLKDWQLSADNKEISKIFKFKKFDEIVSFIMEMASFSKRINHYPETIIIQFPKITLKLTTKEAKGLTEKDFVLAKEIEEIIHFKLKWEKFLTSPKVIAFLLILLLLVFLWQYLK